MQKTDASIQRAQALCFMQSELDAHIIDKKNITLSEERLLENTILALSVELGELANEVRSFKHWSSKGPSDTWKILGEYVDAMHFLFSLTNQFLGAPIRSLYCDLTPSKTEDWHAVNLMFLSLQSTITEFWLANALSDWSRTHPLLVELWEMMWTLGEMLGFSTEQVWQGYIQKYLENFRRQANGY